MYDSYIGSAVKYCEGDVEKAERFVDCNVYQYFYRVKLKKEYTEWHNEEVKKATNKGRNDDN